MVFAWTLGTYAVFTTASGYLQQFQDATGSGRSVTTVRSLPRDRRPVRDELLAASLAKELHTVRAAAHFAMLRLGPLGHDRHESRSAAHLGRLGRPCSGHAPLVRSPRSSSLRQPTCLRLTPHGMSKRHSPDFARLAAALHGRLGGRGRRYLFAQVIIPRVVVKRARAGNRCRAGAGCQPVRLRRRAESR